MPNKILKIEIDDNDDDDHEDLGKYTVDCLLCPKILKIEIDHNDVDLENL